MDARTHPNLPARLKAMVRRVLDRVPVSERLHAAYRESVRARKTYRRELLGPHASV